MIDWGELRSARSEHRLLLAVLKYRDHERFGDVLAWAARTGAAAKAIATNVSAEDIAKLEQILSQDDVTKGALAQMLEAIQHPMYPEALRLMHGEGVNFSRGGHSSGGHFEIVDTSPRGRMFVSHPYARPGMIASKIYVVQTSIIRLEDGTDFRVITSIS